MKKLLLTSALCAALSSSAMAGQAGEFYGGGEVGYVKLKKFSKEKVFKGLSSAKYDTATGNDLTAVATGATDVGGNVLADQRLIVVVSNLAVRPNAANNNFAYADATALAAAANAINGIEGLTANSSVIVQAMAARAATYTAYAGANAAAWAVGQNTAAGALADKVALNYPGILISAYGIAQDNISVKSKGAGFIGVKGGYYAMDNVAVGASLRYYFNPKQNITGSVTNGGVTNTAEYQIKSNIMAFMLEGKVDVVDMDMFKLYIDAGVGISRVKGKLKAKGAKSGASSAPQAELDAANGNFKSFGSKTNFAWQIGLGVDGEFSEGMHANFGVRYADLGKTKSVSKVFEESLPHRGYEIKLGIRFDI